MCGHGFSLTLRLQDIWTFLGTAEVLLGVVLVFLGFLQHAVVARCLEGRLRLNKMPRSLIVEGAGRERAGSESRQVGQVHVVAS